MIKIAPFSRFALGFALIALTLQTQPASNEAVPPCNGWTLHTRTLPTICPEMIVDGLTAQGAASIWGLAFDAEGALLFTRPATGQVMRLAVAAGRPAQFDPPQVVADGLDFPTGIGCAAEGCYVSAQTTIVQIDPHGIQPPHSIYAGLSSDHLHPLRIGGDGRLYTVDGSHLISLARDGTDQKVERDLPADLPGDPADFDWAADGTPWLADNAAALRALGGGALTLTAGSQPSGLAFYHGAAFPAFAGGLLAVTAGSYASPTFTGYELLYIPFDAKAQPGIPVRLIPADTDRALSDAALYLLTFFPNHPVTVAIGPEGWIYIALREGQIVRLRPRSG